MCTMVTWLGHMFKGDNQNNYNSQNLCPLIHNLRHCNLLDVKLSPLNMWPSHVTIVHINLACGLGCLTPLTTIFQLYVSKLYCSSQFYWWFWKGCVLNKATVLIKINCYYTLCSPIEVKSRWTFVYEYIKKNKINQSESF
jgi:hypothetical protein